MQLLLHCLGLLWMRLYRAAHFCNVQAQGCTIKPHSQAGAWNPPTSPVPLGLAISLWVMALGSSLMPILLHCTQPRPTAPVQCTYFFPILICLAGSCPPESRRQAQNKKPEQGHRCDAQGQQQGHKSDSLLYLPTLSLF